MQRNRTERLSELLDWQTLGQHYRTARRRALQVVHPEYFTTRKRGSGASTPMVYSCQLLTASY